MNPKTCLLIAAIGSFVTGTFASRAVSFTDDIDVWGPYECPACNLDTPVPDVVTRNLIARLEWINYKNEILLSIFSETGDQYIVCNSAFCVTYDRTSSARWVATKKAAREGNRGAGVPTNEGGGGGGDGTGGGASGNGNGGTLVGGGAGDQGRGTVKVGKPRKKEN